MWYKRQGPEHSIVTVTGAFLVFALNLILLCMFIRKLWLLYRAMIQQLVADQMIQDKLGSQAIELESGTASIAHSNASTSEKNVDICAVMQRYEAGSMQDRDKIIRIVELYHVMKKHTILICIAILSTWAYQLYLAIDIMNALRQFPYDACINAICVWLILASSQKYWKCCTKYGCCICCYKNDIN